MYVTIAGVANLAYNIMGEIHEDFDSASLVFDLILYFIIFQ